MFEKINWLDVARQMREKSAYDSFTVLKQKSNFIDKKAMNDFIFDMVFNLSDKEIESILYNDNIVNELSLITNLTLFSHKQEQHHNKTFLTSLYSLVAEKRIVREKTCHPKSYKGIDKTLRDCVRLTNVKDVRQSLYFTYDNNEMLCRDISALEILIRMDMVETVKEIGVKLGKSIFCVDDYVKSISSVEMLKLYEDQGGTLWRKNINKAPLWIELYYTIKESDSVSEKEKELFQHIEKVIPEKEIRKIDMIKYLTLLESAIPIESFYKNISGWQYIKDSQGRNVFMNLLRRNSNALLQHYREDCFCEQLHHKDNEGANIWKYIFMFTEHKTNKIKLPTALMRYIHNRNGKTQLDKNGLGLLAQSGAYLNPERNPSDKSIMKLITQEEWLGNDKGQNIFANQIIEFILEGEGDRDKNKYYYLIDYICQYVSVDSINNNLKYALLMFYGLIRKHQDKDFEDKIINADLVCPSEFELIHDDLVSKINLRDVQSRNKEIIDRSAIKSKLLEASLRLRLSKSENAQKYKSKNRI